MTNKKNGGVSPIIAAVTGAVVGAGVAVVGAAMRDEKNRDKVKEVLNNVKDQAIDYAEEMQKQARNKIGEVEEKIAERKEKLKLVADSATDSIEREIKNVKKKM